MTLTQILTLYEQILPQGNLAEWIESAAVAEQVAQLQRVAQGQTINPDLLTSLQDNLRSLEQPAVLLYPLILEDRLELVLITPNAPPIRRTVTVTRQELTLAIATFRSALSPTRNPTEEAQQLYQWLIQPIEADLQQAGAETILYAADGQLRYIPLAALHDGNQWLIQRFRINHITAASLTDFSAVPPSQVSVLAAAFSDPQRNYQFSIGP
jgi:CHAT domain-containing protein